jgi:hypothetical protein
MTTRVSERWTGERCKNGARVLERTEKFYVEQQSEPYETTVERLCCPACEANE